MRAIAAIAVLLLLPACANTSSPVTQCTDPRPQVCTMQYAPVCATLLAGGSKGYSSGCNACADDRVASHMPGTCPE